MLIRIADVSRTRARCSAQRARAALARRSFGCPQARNTVAGPQRPRLGDCIVRCSGTSEVVSPENALPHSLGESGARPALCSVENSKAGCPDPASKDLDPPKLSIHQITSRQVELRGRRVRWVGRPLRQHRSAPASRSPPAPSTAARAHHLRATVTLSRTRRRPRGTNCRCGLTCSRAGAQLKGMSCNVCQAQSGRHKQ